VLHLSSVFSTNTYFNRRPLRQTSQATRELPKFNPKVDFPKYEDLKYVYEGKGNSDVSKANEEECKKVRLIGKSSERVEPHASPQVLLEHEMEHMESLLSNSRHLHEPRARPPGYFSPDVVEAAPSNHGSLMPSLSGSGKRHRNSFMELVRKSFKGRKDRVVGAGSEGSDLIGAMSSIALHSARANP